MRIVIMIGALTIALSAQSRVYQILPIDEASREPSLVAMRSRLVAAVRAHDAESVIELMHPEIRWKTIERRGTEEARSDLRWPSISPDGN